MLGKARAIFANRFKEAEAMLGTDALKPYSDYKDLFDGELEVESARIAYAIAHTPPPGLGKLLLAGMGVIAAAIRGDEGTGHTGSQRDWRNAHISTRLDERDELAKECSPNAGNEDWNKRRGTDLIKHASKNFDDIKETMDGAEAQGDHRAFRNRLSKVTDSLETSLEKAQMESLRETVRALRASMEKFVEKIKASIRSRFGAPKHDEHGASNLATPSTPSAKPLSEVASLQPANTEPTGDIGGYRAKPPGMKP